MSSDRKVGSDIAWARGMLVLLRQEEFLVFFFVTWITGH